VFAGFSVAFVPLLLAGVVIQVLTVAGLILCILPGIYLFVIWWGFVPLLVLDKKMDFWPAMELSRKMVHHHGWQMVGLMLAAVVVTIAGLLVFGVGVFFTLPLAIAAVTCAYLEVFDPPDTPVPSDPTGPDAPTQGEAQSVANQASVGAKSEPLAGGVGEADGAVRGVNQVIPPPLAASEPGSGSGAGTGT
jgi:hypothetical protein